MQTIHPGALKSLKALLMSIAVATVMTGCASFDGVKVAQDAHTEVYVYPNSVRPHTGGKITDFEAKLLVNFTARPRPNIADGRDLLPLSGRPDINTNDCAERFLCIRSGVMDVVFQCDASGRKSYRTQSVVATMLRFGHGTASDLPAREAGSVRTAEPGSLIEKAYDEVCSRPQAREAIAKASQQEAAQRERERLDAAAAWRTAQAQQEARQQRLAEERQRRERAEFENRLREIDEALRKADEEMRRSDDYTACSTAREAVQKAGGTDRLERARATEKRLCDAHERLAAQRRAQLQIENERINRLCTGTPRVPREQSESLARQLTVSPLALSFNRLNSAGSGMCSMTVYHPRGVSTCWVSLDAQGAVQHIRNCQ